MGDEVRQEAVGGAIKILKEMLESIPSGPSSCADDPNNKLPPSFESVAPYLVPSSELNDEGGLFTLPSTEPLASTRKYNRRWAVLPSMMANVSCSRIKPETLLSWLNTIFEKRFMPSNGVKACLLRFIDDGCDLGQVYGYLRPWMDDIPDEDAFSRIPDQVAECRKKDFKLRSAAIDSNRIVNPEVPPRRVWDLYANRVLPFYAISSLPLEDPSEIMPKKLWAVSHSWVPSSKRQSVLTTINGQAWRVPIPLGTSLEEIRSELLILGAEYVFLDVLCLRQKDEPLPDFESIRKREWRLDVPTIGYVYSDWRPVIVYFDGLGLPFRDGGENCGDKFHWFNRAWTLQEYPVELIPGGLEYKINAFSVATFDVSSSWASQNFCRKFRSMMRIGDATSRDKSQVGQYVREIQSRYCSNPVDQVACLAYLLGCRTLPIYDADMDVEVAWSLLVECLPDKIRTDLLVSNFGSSGRAGSWRPTWEQVTARGTTFRSMSLFESPDPLYHLDGSSPDAGFRYGSDAYYSKSYVIQDCLISIVDSKDSQRAKVHVSVPCTCNATPHRHRFYVSEWDDPISPNVTYLLVRVGFGVWSDGWWLLAQPKGIRLIKNERAIEVFRVSVLKISDTGYDKILDLNRVKGRTMFVVYL